MHKYYGSCIGQITQLNSLLGLTIMLLLQRYRCQISPTPKLELSYHKDQGVALVIFGVPYFPKFIPNRNRIEINISPFRIEIESNRYMYTSNRIESVESKPVLQTCVRLKAHSSAFHFLKDFLEESRGISTRKS